MGWEGDASSLAKEFSATTDGIFSVKPIAGEINAEDFVLVCISFKPSRVHKLSQLLRLIVNGAPGGKLLLEGTGGLPCLRLVDLFEAIATVSPLLYEASDYATLGTF